MVLDLELNACMIRMETLGEIGGSYPNYRLQLVLQSGFEAIWPSSSEGDCKTYVTRTTHSAKTIRIKQAMLDLVSCWTVTSTVACTLASVASVLLFLV